MVWTCHEEKTGVCKKSDRNGVTRKEKKRKAKENIFGFSAKRIWGKLVQGRRTLKTAYCGGISPTVATPE